MIKPFLEQASPHGQAMSGEQNGFGSQNFNAGSSSSQNAHQSPKKSGSQEYISFTAELTTDRVLPKIRELNSEPDKTGIALSEDQLSKIGFVLDKVAMLDVKVCS